MSARCLLLVALAFVAAGFAPAPFPRARRTAKQDDLTKMQGTWVTVRYESGGTDTLPSYKEEICFIFTGTSMSCTVGGQVRSTWDFELTPGAAPRAVTKTIRNGGRYVLRGIYRFEGDRLFVCEAQNGERPTEFDSRSRGQVYLIELRRR